IKHEYSRPARRASSKHALVADEVLAPAVGPAAAPESHAVIYPERGYVVVIGKEYDAVEAARSGFLQTAQYKRLCDSPVLSAFLHTQSAHEDRVFHFFAPARQVHDSAPVRVDRV